MPRQSSPEPAPRNRGGRSYPLDLKSGGTVTVTINVNPFELDNGDRAFVFELVDLVTKYSNGAKAQAKPKRPDPVPGVLTSDTPDTPESPDDHGEHTGA